MSATSQRRFGEWAAGPYTVARQRRIQSVLKTHGPLTRSALHEMVRPCGWHVPFEVALERAIDSGRVRPVGSELYEAGSAR